jgi:hypothetical protein
LDRRVVQPDHPPFAAFDLDTVVIVVVGVAVVVIDFVIVVCAVVVMMGLEMAVAERMRVVGVPFVDVLRGRDDRREDKARREREDGQGAARPSHDPATMAVHARAPRLDTPAVAKSV